MDPLVIIRFRLLRLNSSANSLNVSSLFNCPFICVSLIVYSFIRCRMDSCISVSGCLIISILSGFYLYFFRRMSDDDFYLASREEASSQIDGAVKFTESVEKYIADITEPGQ